MPLMDEFKEEREAMKHGTLKQKLAYFWDYYKWHTIAVIAIAALAGSLIHQVVTHKDIAFYAMLLNGGEINFMADSSENTAAFAEYAGIDRNEYEILYDTTVHTGSDSMNELESNQKLMVYIAAGDIDVMVSDPDSLTRYAYQSQFHDLRSFLTAEQFEKYQDSFYYTDGAVVKALAEATELHDLTYIPEYGDPRHPEQMEDPIPTGIFLSENSPLLKDYVFRQEEVAVSVLINTKRPELASRYIDFLMQQ